MKQLYSPLRTGSTIVLSPPSKRWLYTKQGERFVKDLLHNARVRRFESVWLNPEKPFGRFGLSLIQSTLEAKTLIHRRSPGPIAITTKYLVIIGDVHGHLSPLQSGIIPWLDKDTTFIFTGDYVSKGPKSLETVQWLDMLSQKERNCYFLTGNHELHLEDWIMGVKQSKKDFVNTWPSALNPGHHTPKKPITKFLSKLDDHLQITWLNHHFMISHGGISHPEDTDTKASHYIYGTGTPTTDIDKEWAKNTTTDTIQIHGHRNVTCGPTHRFKNSWNLEGIESAEEVRLVALDRTTPSIGLTRSINFDGTIKDKQFSL